MNGQLCWRDYRYREDEQQFWRARFRGLNNQEFLKKDYEEIVREVDEEIMCFEHLITRENPELYIAPNKGFYELDNKNDNVIYHIESNNEDKCLVYNVSSKECSVVTEDECQTYK